MEAKRSECPAPRPAATVILVRRQAGELQVFLVKRSRKSGFMAGNYVFPGGVIDPTDRDADFWKTCIDLDSTGIQSRLGGDLSVKEAIAYGVAAIRETFEEAGVFLAHGVEPFERKLERGRENRLQGRNEPEWFRKLVTSGKWTLSLSSLSRWSHWITPRLMKKRYDTRFFLATMPSGQVCRPDNREIVHGIWVTPEIGLDGNLKGEIPLSPPTVITLHELLKYQAPGILEKKSETRQWGDALLPRLVILSRGSVIIEPWDPFYDRENIEINPEKLEKAVTPVGEPFSRVWYNGEIWRPIRI